MLPSSLSNPTTGPSLAWKGRALRPVYPALGLAFLTAWVTAVLLQGRALPWQANVSWALTFASSFALSGLWWWRFCSRIGGAEAPVRERYLAMAMGTGPFVATACSLLVLTYVSDRANHLLGMPYWNMAFIAGVVLPLVISWSLQRAATAWLQAGGAGLARAVRSTLASQSRPMILASLVAIAVLQGSVSVQPIGDDVWHYIKVADALSGGQAYPTETLGEQSSYPVDIMGRSYQTAGMGRVYPALPTFPIALAIAFALIGHNLIAVGFVLVVVAALFPLAMYAACISLTGSRPFAFVATILFYLLPPYQIHLLGSPEPDPLFVTLLLLVAAMAARANRSPRQRHWVALGVMLGFTALTRHEGLIYSAALFLTFLPFHGLRARYWLAAAAWAAVILPFVAMHYTSTGRPWPTTFAGTLSIGNVESNLAILNWLTLEWYAQAIGVGKDVLLGLLAAVGLAVALAAVALWRRSPALLFIPLAGLGDIAMGLMVHPQVMQTPSPIEFMRHTSSGIAYVALSSAYASYTGYRILSRRMKPRARGWLMAALLLLTTTGMVYESELLARPEWYFEGHTSLLWTGSGYLFTDLARYPIALPEADDPRDGEQLRNDLGLPLDAIDLRVENRSEPYHWTTLMVALFGILYASADVVHNCRKSQREPAPTASTRAMEP